MNVLSREALLAAASRENLPTERVEIKELGGVVIVRGMTGSERDAWERSLVVGRGKRRDINTENVRAKLAVRCLVDEQGQRLFSDAEAGALGQLRVDVLNRIYEAAQRVCGVSDEDIDELKKFSEAEAGSASSSS